MLKNKISLFYILLIQASNLSLVLPTQAQIFQNNNFSCEDKVVVGQIEGPPFDAFGNPYMSTSLACGNLDSLNDSNEHRFPDCITQRSPLPIAMDFVASNSLLVNTEAHGKNCVNVGEANAQFENSATLSNGAFNTEQDTFKEMGTIRSGNLSGNTFDDIAFVSRPNFASPIEPSIQYLFSENQGGFPAQFNPSVVDLDNALMQQPFTYTAYFFNNDRVAADRTLLLMNCDADPVDEAIVTVQLSADTVGFLVSQNQGQGLQDVTAQGVFSLPTAINESSRVVLTQGDFNGDEILDLVLAVNTRNDGNDSVIFCAGDGACGFSCPDSELDPEVFNLTAACEIPNCNPQPSSISSGDFNGDGLLDVAIAESRSSQLRYLFNNNAAGSNGKIANWDSTTISFAKPNSAVLPLIVTTGRFSPQAFQSNVQELAVTVAEFVPDLNGDEADSLVYIVTTDGAGGLNDPIPLNFSPQNSIAVSSLETKDFDRCGGDDIIALAHTVENPDMITRRASLFLNTNEPAVIDNISPNISAKVQTSILLQASCSDPTRDDRAFSWEVTQAPTGANAVFDNPAGTLLAPNTEANTQFQANRAGEYTIAFHCEDFCGLGETQQFSILLEQEIPPPPPPLPLSQGGCIASLTLQDSHQANYSWVLYSVYFFSAFLALSLRLKKKL